MQESNSWLQPIQLRCLTFTSKHDREISGGVFLPVPKKSASEKKAVSGRDFSSLAHRVDMLGKIGVMVIYIIFNLAFWVEAMRAYRHEKDLGRLL